MSIHILAYNGEQHYPALFASLLPQVDDGVIVRIAENGSRDGSRAWLQAHAQGLTVLYNGQNLGFAGGHNQLIRLALAAGDDPDQTFALVLNQDMVLAPDALAQLRAAAQAHPEAAAFQPKILRLLPAPSPEEDGQRSDVIDSTGLMLGRSWRMEDRGAGEVDRGQYDTVPPFGPSGACALWRFSALQRLMINGEVFDEDFFSYREDCDLALRARKMGMETIMVPGAKVWHTRGVYGAQGRNIFQRFADRRRRSPQRAAWATRNQLLLLVKELSLRDFAWTWPFVFFAEGARLAVALVFEPATRSMLFHSLPHFVRVWRKRRVIKENTVVSSSALRAWMRRG